MKNQKFFLFFSFFIFLNFYNILNSKSTNFSKYFSQTSEFIKTKVNSLSDSVKSFYKSEEKEVVINKTFNNLTELTINDTQANIELSTWNSSKTEVKLIKFGKEEAINLSQETLAVKDKNLTINNSPENLKKKYKEVKVNYKILVPESLNITLNLNKGNIDIKDSNGKIAVNLNNGIVAIEGGTGEVIVQLNKGGINFEREAQAKNTTVNLLIKRKGNINLFVPQNINAAFNCEVKNGSINAEHTVYLAPTYMKKINSSSLAQFNKNLNFCIFKDCNESNLTSKIVAITNNGNINIADIYA